MEVLFKIRSLSFSLSLCGLLCTTLFTDLMVRDLWSKLGLISDTSHVMKKANQRYLVNSLMENIKREKHIHKINISSKTQRFHKVS